MHSVCTCAATRACISRHTHTHTYTCIMWPYMHKCVCVNINLCTDAHKQHRSTLLVTFGQSAARSCSLQSADSRLHVSFLPRKRDWTRGNTLTGSPGVLTRVRAARGKEWLWEAVPPLSSLSTDYEAGPRRVPLGTPQATHSLPLLCYRICRWGIRLKCEEGCMWETCREF